MRALGPINLFAFQLAVGIGAGFVAASDTSANENWTLTAPFKSPESVAVSDLHNAIFVSNVNGYTTNGKGFISRLSLSGEMVAANWLSGLNAPTGLTVDGDILWAVDFNRLAKIDIKTATIIDMFPAPDDRPLLNDVAVSDQGAVFVTGSASNSIYQLVDGKLVTWMKDDKLLAYANGIYANEDEVVVAAYHLVRINRENKQTNALGDKEVLFDLEGVKPDGAGGYFVSVIGERPVYRLSDKGVLTPLFGGYPYVADFDIWQGTLIAPTGAQTVTSFQLPGPHAPR